MKLLRWIRWIFSRPSVEVVEIDGKTRIVKHGGITVQWAEQEDDKC